MSNIKERIDALLDDSEAKLTEASRVLLLACKKAIETGQVPEQILLGKSSELLPAPDQFDLTVRFESIQVRDEFCTWLSGQSEQSFYGWVEEILPNFNPIFRYRTEDESLASNDPARYGEFMGMKDRHGNPMIVVKEIAAGREVE